MLGIRYIYLILLICSVSRGQKVPSPCEGQSTVWDLVQSDPELSFTAAQMNRSATSSLWDANNGNVTLFAPANSAWPDIPSSGVIEGPSFPGQALPLYTSLEGRYTAEDLFAVPSVNSILGMLNGKDYVVSAARDPNDSQTVLVSGQSGHIAQVLDVVGACNGLLYKINKVISPFDYANPAGGSSNNNSTSVDIVNNITSSVNDVAAINTIVKNGYSGCTTNFTKAMASIPNTKSWMKLMESTGMLPALNNPLLSATVLVPLDQATQIDGATADAVMYNMLPGAYCPNELLNFNQSKNSMLGAVMGRDQPLGFFNDGGALGISGVYGVSKVIDSKIACNSVILVTNAPLILPRPPVIAPSVLPTLPIRHLTCDIEAIDPNGGGGSGNNTNPDNGGGGGSTDSTSSNSALAIGLGVGLGCAALLALLAAFIYLQRGRRKSGFSTGSPSIAGRTGSKSTLYSEKKDSLEAGTLNPELTTTSGTTGVNTSLSEFGTSSSSLHSNTAPNSTIFASLVSNPTATLLLEPTAQRNEQLASRLLGKRGSASSAPDGGPGRDLWEISASDVQIVVDADGKPVELGKGSFGSVYRGTLRTVQPAAVKVLNASIGNEAEAAFQREAAILKHVNRDKNVVQLYGTSKMPDGKLLLVTELMEGGDLRRALNDPVSREALAWHRTGKKVALDISRGLTALHAVNVVHRDLKSKNVLLTDTCTAKIGDVGIAAVQSQGYLTASAGSVIGTLVWSAPEQILGERCTEKVDIYSFGIVLWEIATGQMPRRGFTSPPPPSERCPAELAELIVECTASDARIRPTAKEAYERILGIPPL